MINLIFENISKRIMKNKKTKYILTDITGIVSNPQAKNSKNITTRAWCTLGSPIPEL